MRVEPELYFKLYISSMKQAKLFPWSELNDDNHQSFDKQHAYPNNHIKSSGKLYTYEI